MDNIEPIGIKFKQPADEERMLKTVYKGAGCFNHAYLIDEEASQVTCAKCDKIFNPMAVLLDLSRKESTWMMNRKRSIEAMEKLEKRSRTKCYNCGKMTRI